MDNGTLRCARCQTTLHPGQGDFFVVRIEAFADPTPPDISQEELESTDHRKEIERLIEAMRDKSEQELMDQIYRRLMIHLCTPCYKQWIEGPAG
jgi:hypothetical protein